MSLKYLKTSTNPNGSISSPEKGNDYLGFALRTALIAFTRQIKTREATIKFKLEPDVMTKYGLNEPSLIHSIKEKRLVTNVGPNFGHLKTCMCREVLSPYR